MQHLNKYRVFESEETQQFNFPKSENEINILCEKYNINKYIINNDLSINVDGDVNLVSQKLTYLPLNFNIVNGNFDCYNNKLKSLIGSPNNVLYCYDCSGNSLASTQYMPKRIGEYLNLSYNRLKDIKHIPTDIKGDIYIHNNPIYSLVNIFIGKIDKGDYIVEFNEYNIIYKNKIILDRLKAFCSDFDLVMPSVDEVKKYYEII